MPPVLAPLAVPPPPAAQLAPPSVSPSAEAVIPPAPTSAPPTKPAEKPRVASATHSMPAHHRARFTALMKHLTSRHTPTATHRAALSRPVPEPAFAPPGMVGPPPDYYGPGPYQRLVYAGPPPAVYGWGYRGRFPY